jgi:hypothetical protein
MWLRMWHSRRCFRHKLGEIWAFIGRTFGQFKRHIKASARLRYTPT